MKKARVVFRICLIAVGAYIAISLWVSIQLQMLVNRACETRGEFDPSVSEYISESLYSRLNTRAEMRYIEGYELDVVEVDKRTFPLTVHSFVSAKSIFWYTYEYMGYNEDGKEMTTGSWNIPITVWLKLEGLKWVVVDVYEAP